MCFETWSQTLIETSNTKAEVFVATNGITPLMVDGQVDPHAWNSLKNGMQYVANIADGCNLIYQKVSVFFNITKSHFS